jgi:CRP-like cAMP-binding protein
MDDAELKAVAMIAEDLRFDTGNTIVEAGKPADALYFLIEGDISLYFVVTTEHDPDYRAEYYICDINADEIFGISALIEPYVYTSTLRVNMPCRVIKLDASALRALCEVDSRLSYGLMRAVAKSAMERLTTTRIHLIAKA